MLNLQAVFYRSFVLILTLGATAASCQEAAPPVDAEPAVQAVDDVYIQRLRDKLNEVQALAAFIKQAGSTADDQQLVELVQAIEQSVVTAKVGGDTLAARPVSPRPATRFEPTGELVQRNVREGEVIENVTLENVLLRGHLAHGAVLRNVTIMNGAIGFFSSDDVTLENVRVIGGHHDEGLQAAFMFAANKNLNCHNLAAYDHQRGAYFAVNVSGSSEGVVVDGLLVDGYHNWTEQDNRSEPLLLHGYDNGDDNSFSGKFKNVTVRNRFGAITLWMMRAEGVSFENINGVDGFTFGLDENSRYNDIEISDVNPMRKAEVRWRYYMDPKDLNPQAVGRVVAPEGWEHVLLQKHPKVNFREYEVLREDQAQAISDWLDEWTRRQ